MKKYFLITLIFLGYFSLAQIQMNSTNHTSSNWRMGGGIGLSFGSNDRMDFNISPFVGYAISPQIETGITTGYQYAKWGNYQQNLFNIGPYVNVYPIQQLFLRAHYEYYTGNQKHKSSVYGNSSHNFDDSALWLGGGYRTTGPIQFFTGVMYNVLYENNSSSIFSSGLRPIIGVSIAL